MMAHLVHAPSYHGQDALLLVCDETLLEWLHRRFDMLERSDPASQPAFSIGQGENVESENGVQIRFVLSREPATSRITRVDQHFTWRISPDIAAKFRELVRGLEACNVPCHQYLDSGDPSSPILVLSKGEYGDAALQRMRGALVLPSG
jgi:hypothetical protein